MTISTNKTGGVTINIEQKWLRYRFWKGDYDSELLMAFIDELACLGMIENEDNIEAFFPYDKATEIEREIPGILASFSNVTIKYQQDSIVNEDWHLNWQKYFQPIRISPNLAIYPHWQDYRGTEKIQIAIKPGMAFGTGTHPTTQMALRLIEKYIEPGMVILDAGCGSGILSIAALKLGASFVEAWDIDPDVAGNFHEHMELNNIHDRFSLKIGDITKHDQYDVDFVLSNIERTPNLTLLKNMHKYGKIPPCIFTGILKDEYAMFKSKVLNYGLIFKEEMFQNEWVALVTA